MELQVLEAHHSQYPNSPVASVCATSNLMHTRPSQRLGVRVFGLGGPFSYDVPTYNHRGSRCREHCVIQSLRTEVLTTIARTDRVCLSARGVVPSTQAVLRQGHLRNSIFNKSCLKRHEEEVQRCCEALLWNADSETKADKEPLV